MGPQLQAILQRIDAVHLDQQVVARFATRRAAGRKLHGKRFDPDQTQLVALSQPTQKLGLPLPMAVGLKPDLTPVALVIAADLVGLTLRLVDRVQQGLQQRLIHGGLLVLP